MIESNVFSSSTLYRAYVLDERCRKFDLPLGLSPAYVLSEIFTKLRAFDSKDFQQEQKEKRITYLEEQLIRWGFGDDESAIAYLNYIESALEKWIPLKEAHDAKVKEMADSLVSQFIAENKREAADE